ncbi:hypothetical protein BHE74_00022960 [Ensete ventricosum]|nr:hypothetical protein GW17_00010533 [Ensete ventricosum]RWW69437.1 hypothetical protein BHE74_00022960 [Ensete ventricosum]RZS03738.1 hypothetical protein BHM03_00033950 [Ensete ventricosum]
MAFNLLQKELKLQHELGEELEKLCDNVSMIQAVINKAEEKAHSDEPLKLWLEKLRKVGYDAVDVLDELNYEAQRQQLVSLSRVRDSFSMVNLKRSITRHIMSRKMQAISERLNNLKKEAETYNIRVEDASSHPAERDALAMTTSLQPPVVLGREDDKHRILKMLLQADRMHKKSISVIPILGMCGVGKTTLAQLVSNDEVVMKHFEMRFWVDVSHDFNEERLTKAIIESTGSSAVDHINMDNLQKQLLNMISGRRYLLVLDNVWNENPEKWRKLRLPLLHGAEGSKILVTTRCEEVAKIMGTTSPYVLKGLSDKHCWNLFCQYVFEHNKYLHSDIDDIAEEIPRKCKGLPLAAISIANQLLGVSDRSEWRSIIRCKIEEFSGHDSEFQKAFSLSYQQLPPHLKPCFAYCSIIPEGCEFEKEFIVELWIAQNFIHSERKSAEDLGKQYFDILVQRSFFGCSQSDHKRGKPKYRMHELVHDFALRASAKECSTIEIGKPCKVDPETRHLSLTLSQLEPNDKMKSNSPAQTDIFSEIYQCKGLYTLLLFSGSRKYSLKVPDRLGEELKSLRALDLSNCDLRELPKSIGELKHLRCLRFHNTNLSSLPESLGRLYNLQILGLRNCYSLEELPSDIKYLRNLRHLDLHLDDNSVEAMCKLKSISPHIGLLTNLQTLSRFVVSTKAGCGLGELKDLNSLHGELILSNLHLVRNPLEAKKANLTNKNSIQSLQLRWNIGTTATECVGYDENILTTLRPHTNIKELRIIGYRAPSFPSWLGDSAFTNLELLHLSSCNQCRSLPPLGKLPKLRELHIKGMESVTVVDREFCGKEHGTFPKLEKLVFENIGSLQIWDEHKLPLMSIQPKERCPRLRGIPRFQSLTSLEMSSCGDWIWHSWPCLTSLTSLRLSRLPIETLPSEAGRPHASLRTLKISYCNQLISLPDNWLPNGLVCFSIKHCPRLYSLPEGLENLKALEDLELQDCGLEYLPELKNLTSLVHMEIADCLKVHCLPRNGLPITLQFLSINNCPELKKRCQAGRGEDWPKIRDIFSVWMDEKLVTYRN